MATQDMAILEKTGTEFSGPKMPETRARAQNTGSRVAARVKPGMLEEDANKIDDAFAQKWQTKGGL